MFAIHKDPGDSGASSSAGIRSNGAFDFSKIALKHALRNVYKPCEIMGHTFLLDLVVTSFHIAVQ